MKILTYISFNAKGRTWERIKEILRRAGCEKVIEKGPSSIGFYAEKFYEDDPALHRLRSLLADEGLKWLERYEHEYTPSELQIAPLLVLTVTRVSEELGGPAHGTQYDLSRACPTCGTGAVQTSPLFLKASKIPKKGSFFATLSGEVLVSQRVADCLTVAGVTGLELRVARSQQDGSILPWWQLLADTVLPAMSSATKGVLREEQCLQCKRDGHFSDLHEPFGLVYERRDLDVSSLPDVVRSFEHFGLSRLKNNLSDSHFARSLLLVKPKVYDLFEQLKIRELEYALVRIV